MAATPTYAQELAARQDFEEDVRERLRDYPELNRLIEGVEHSDRLIQHAIHYTLDDFNATPPPVGVFFVYSFPDMNMLMDGVLALLLESAVYLYARNDVVYAHSGTQVSFPQVQTYLGMADRLMHRYEQKKSRWKVAENARQAVAAAGGFFTTFLYTFRPAWRVYSLTDYSSPRVY